MTLESTSLDLAAGAFSALGDPIRLQVLGVLRDGMRCVCELREEIDVAPNLLSYHLKVLRDAGLVVATRRGRWVDYRIDEDALGGLRDLIPGEDG
ncbi:MAG: metalloregulator ArsR/SmtB family transcription factor [Acidimicrobiia bacterium]|nr:metalloregulator ArsR/SmtB family transcription factor [Acidimicrobiia bacterium]